MTEVERKGPADMTLEERLYPKVCRVCGFAALSGIARVYGSCLSCYNTDRKNGRPNSKTARPRYNFSGPNTRRKGGI